MKKAIVITTIFKPSEAVRKFAAMEDYQLFVIGDKKSPLDWALEGVCFVSFREQMEMPFQLASKLPANHYCRKMLGYLEAMKWGAEQIIDTDDDNIPLAGWGFPGTNGDYETVVNENGFVNIYSWFTKQKIWPRGLPLSLINTQLDTSQVLKSVPTQIGVWQSLANEDPDVDAIYRLTSNAPCIFENREPLVLPKRTLCPFNSQNTLFIKDLFALLYLPALVSFRFTDILRSLVAQPIMWLYDYKLGFTEATVIQERNPHDYFTDYLSETPMYEHGHRVPGIVEGVVSKTRSIPENLVAAYTALENQGIVPPGELEILAAWLADIKQFENFEIWG